MKAYVGLIGAKRAGKDTAFEAIKNTLSGAVKITLAAKLKICCSQVTGIPVEYFDLDAFKERELDDIVQLSREDVIALFKFYNYEPDFDSFIRPHIGKVLKTPRQVAQYVGTEVLRYYDPDIHCKAATVDLSGDFGVITDLRFPNEYEFFKAQGKPYNMIYIQNMAAESEAAKDSHASEAYLTTLAKKADFTVTNNGSLESFKAAVTKLSNETLKSVTQ